MSFTHNHLFFDDVVVDQEWRSPRRTVTETDIVNFAGLSGDFNAIHMDHEFAKTSVYRKPIAHGLLVLTMSSGLSVASPPMRTLALLTIRDCQFKEPVFVGDTIHVWTKVLEKEVRARGRRGAITWQRHIINQHDKTVLESTSVTLVEGRAAIKKR